MNDPVEAALIEAGQRWRDLQPGPPEPDVSRFTSPEHRKWTAARRWAPATAVAGVAVAMAVVLVPLSLLGGPQPVAGTGTTPGTSAKGVRVEGFGHLIQDADGHTRLCALTIVPGVKGGAPPRCAGRSVVVTGVDGALMAAHPGRVRVEGTYAAGTLAVARVTGPAPEPVEPSTKPAPPCPAPAGGWPPGHGFADPDEELDASRRLDAAIAAEAERFSGVWVWEHGTAPSLLPGEAGGAVIVKVVGTTDDVARARADLSAVYRGNLCVHPVRYSAVELRRIADRLSAAPSVSAQVEVIRNRVRVSVVALDPPTVALLDEVGRDALILDEPLLQWLE